MQSGNAETFTREGHVDVGILVKEADETIEAVHIAVAHADQAKSARVSTSRGESGVTHVCDCFLDQGQDSEDTRAESQRSKVVAVRPPEALPDVRVTGNAIVVRDVFTREIPCASRNDDAVFVEAVDQSGNPDVEDDHPCDTVIDQSTAVGPNVLIGVTHDGARGSEAHDTEEPDDEHADSNAEVDDGYNDDSLRVSEEIGSCLNNGNGDAKRLELACQAEAEKQSRDPGAPHGSLVKRDSAVGAVGGVCRVTVGNFYTSSDTQHNKGELGTGNHNPGEPIGTPVHKFDVSKSENKGNENRDCHNPAGIVD